MEVARLRARGAADSDDPAHVEAARREITAMMAELRRRTEQAQSDGGAASDRGRDAAAKQCEEYRAKVGGAGRVVSSSHFTDKKGKNVCDTFSTSVQTCLKQRICLAGAPVQVDIFEHRVNRLCDLDPHAAPSGGCRSRGSSRV